MSEEFNKDKATLFRWLLERDVHEYFDTDARPIGEGRSQAYQSVKTTFKSCPYPGSRYQHKHPMSLSALNSILPEWQNALALLSSLSQRYQNYYHKPVDSYYDLALIAGTGVFLTDYMVLRDKNPLKTQQIPVLLSGLYKVCLGFQQATFLAMMNDHFKENEADKVLPNSKGFYAYLEESELLIGEDEVCGGSEIMISRAYEAMVGKTPLPEPKALVTQLDQLSIQWQDYDTFTFHSSNLWRKAILFVIQMQSFRIELNDKTLPSDLQLSINTYLRFCFAELLKQQSGLAVEIAQITLVESGRDLEEWLTVQEAFLDEIKLTSSFIKEDSYRNLSLQIVGQLSQNFNLLSYAAQIAAAVDLQVMHYETFEVAVLNVFNQHLNCITGVLDYNHAGNDITTVDLSLVYGKTLRDLPNIMKDTPSLNL